MVANNRNTWKGRVITKHELMPELVIDMEALQGDTI